ncbi:MAG: cupin domain-containing protein [Desertimonas sp.]
MDDEGGDPACWAHLADEPDSEHTHVTALRIDLSSLRADGAAGVGWSLPHGGDLDANLVRLGPADTIGEHRNDEVDVLVVGQTGAAQVIVDDRVLSLGPGVVVWIPTGTRRRITAGAHGASYLSIHRRRGGITLRPTSR